MTDDRIWSPLLAELDLWASENRQVRLWLRDDDAIAPGPQLDRLAAMAERFEVPVLLAVIPLLAQDALATRLETAPLLAPCQHGCRHLNHAPPGEKKVEIGAHRPIADVLSEIATGRARLTALFGARTLPVFVPPWNRMDRTIAARLPEFGLTGLSLFRGFTLPAGAGPVLVNSDLDIMDWHGGRVGRPAAGMIAETTAALAARRAASARSSDFGLLLHHRDHDDAAWDVLDGLLGRIRAHRAIACPPLRTLFGLPSGLE